MIKRSTGIQDAGAPLVVDAFTRKVTVPATERVIGVVGDHCSEQVRFSLPQSIDNHDMTTCTHSYISWRNVEGRDGTDELVITETANDRVIFGWVVRDAITVAKGLVSFSLNFECWEKDEKTGKEKLVYKWGTHTCTECEILDSLNTVTMGAFEVICIDGETLVFKDYTPVREETLALRSGIIPEGTLEIKEAGKHDVARYAYADVLVKGDTPPTIDISNGVVTATANGLSAEKQLEEPTITIAGGKATATANGLSSEAQVSAEDVVKHTQIELTHEGEGTVKLQVIDRATNIITYVEHDLAQCENPIELAPISGSMVQFTASDGYSIELYDYSGAKPSKVGLHLTGITEGFSHVFWTVPAAAEGTSVALTLYANPWT